MKKTDVRRRKMRKAIGIITAGMMILSVGAMLTGCGKGNKDNAAADRAEAMKTLAYDVNEIKIEEDLRGNVKSKNGKLYGVIYSNIKKNDTYLTSYSIAVMDMEGKLQLKVPVYEQTNENEWGYISGELNVDDGGNITCMLSRSCYDGETGEYSESNQLLTFDPEGALINTLDLDRIVTPEENENGMWFQNYVLDDEGNIYCNFYKCVRVLDKTGKPIFTTEPIDMNDGWIQSVFFTNKGIPAVSVYEYIDDSSSFKIKEIDLETKGYGAEYELPGAYLAQPYSGSGDYLCYTSSETGIAGIRADTLQQESVLNLLNLGIDNSLIDNFTICGDGSFITVGWDYSGRLPEVTLSVIKPVEISQVREKKIISLGCFSLDWRMRSVIADFNRENEDNIINVVSFVDNNDASDWDAAIIKFNNEILAGNIPDILLIDYGMPYDSYVSKGMFTDLYTLIDNDPELSRDDFLPNILTALEADGKLYSIAPSFTVSTYAAKTAFVGDRTSLTIDETNAILNTMGDDARLTAYLMTSSEFLYNAVSYGGYVDYHNGTCSFDTPEFRAVLETAAAYPAEIDYDALYGDDPNYWHEQERACRDNKALLYSTYLYNFDSYNRAKKGNFGEDITFVGFPGASGENTAGGLLRFSGQIAVSEKSRFKEGAWEFIKHMIKDTVTQEEYEIYNYNDDSYDEPAATEMRWVSLRNFPVLTDQLEKLGMQATDPLKRFNENGELVPEQNLYYIADEEIEVSPLTQAEADELIAYLKTVSSISKDDEDLNTIINEEASSYFSGVKSAEETAKMIQSRVSIYLSEQYR